MDTMLNHPAMIIGFSVTVVIMLLLDLGLFNRKSHTVNNREAIFWSVLWIGLSMAFSGVVYGVLGFEKFTQYQSAYWIEKALSVDNLFVFILVFNFFNVSSKLHHKVLFWGVVGALAFRAIFIFAGVEMIKLTYLPEFNLFGHPAKVNVILTIFGLFLVYAGFKSWFVSDDDDEEKDFSRSPGARVIYKLFPVSKEFNGDKFFTIENGKRLATPLLVIVGVVEFTDLIFAVDSIPAIFAIAPDDPFILYTSNIFAILGLRSLYFLLANFIHKFSRLKYGLAVVLAFIGVKMVISPVVHISSPISLAIVGSLLVISLLASLLFPERESPFPKNPHD